MTTPDMSLTIKELLINHSRGIHSNVRDYGEDAYFDTEIPQFDDINDIKDYRDNLKQRLQELEDEIKKEQDSRLLDEQDEKSEDSDDKKVGQRVADPTGKEDKTHKSDSKE